MVWAVSGVGRCADEMLLMILLTLSGIYDKIYAETICLLVLHIQS